MRWLPYLLAYVPLQILAWIITPFLPLFKELRLGNLNNANEYGVGYRLPVWLSWFDTPDNSLVGDEGWFAKHQDAGYWAMVAWLYRNSLYGLKWTVLSRPINDDRTTIGTAVKLDYHTKNYGWNFIYQHDGAWQYKIVKPIFGKIFVGNFGWLLDDMSQKRALFMFSPRFK